MTRIPPQKVFFFNILSNLLFLNILSADFALNSSLEVDLLVGVEVDLILALADWHDSRQPQRERLLATLAVTVTITVLLLL